jgi:competence protein ComEC
MIFWLLGALISQIIVNLFPNLDVVALLFIIVFSYSFINKKKEILLFIPLIIIAFLLSDKPYDIAQDFYGKNFIVVERKNNYSLVKNQENQKFLIYQDLGPSGSRFNADGYYKELSRIKYPGLFEFADYLNNKGVFYELVISQVSHMEIANDYRNEIINYLIDKNGPSSSFLKLIVFSERSDSFEFFNVLKDLSIVHLFIISGFHVTLLFSTLKKLFKVPSLEWIILVILVPYLYLLNFTFPSVKAFLVLVIRTFSNSLLNEKVDGLKVLLFVALIMLAFNPNAIKSYSFVMSILASLNLELFSRVKFKSRIFNYLAFNTLIFLGILPIIMVINYEFNLIAILYNMIFGLIVPPLYISALLATIIKPLQFLLSPIFKGFETLTYDVYQYRIMMIMGLPSLVFMVIYYFNYYLLMLQFEVKNYLNLSTSLLIQFLCLGYQFYKPYIYPTARVDFLNVNQGDSILIVKPYAREVVLVDTGGSRFFEVTASRTIPYLKSLGIKKLDYVVITHPDFDHNGSLPYLVAHFKVDQVIDGREYKSIAGLHNINYGNSYTSDNNQSAVLYFTINKTNFLLTGDIDSKVEHDLVNNYDLKVDVLKVSHHGSRYGTSNLFLDRIKPTIAILSVGARNPYNHPHPEVINRLIANNIKIFRTDLEGTISFIFNQFTLESLLIKIQ